MRQIAALPYRIASGGADAPVSILLVTSRETKRWVIPKGNPMNGVLPHAAAALEAEEEAGVRGAICPTPLGSYRYRKMRKNGASLMLDVDVFPLAVTQELEIWKEKGERDRRWFPLSEAADAVEEPDLAALIRSFGASGPPSAGSAAPAENSTITWLIAGSAGVGLLFYLLTQLP
jgi:8-oxo-dGTP pyrophosphatase MutT (NUDIX family)